MEKPAPQPDRDSEPFWRGIEAHEIRLQRCDACGVFRFPPRVVCNRCFAFDATWVAVSGRGRILSWIVNHQLFSPAFADDLPYIVVQVELEEQDDVQLVGNWLGPGEPEAGMRVEARFVETRPGVTLVQWTPAGAGRSPGDRG